MRTSGRSSLYLFSTMRRLSFLSPCERAAPGGVGASEGSERSGAGHAAETSCMMLMMSFSHSARQSRYTRHIYAAQSHLWIHRWERYVDVAYRGFLCNI